MARTRLRQWFAGTAAVFAVVAGSLALAGAPARAAERVVTVEPAEGLGNQVVRVSWSGFHPTTDDGRFGVLVQQCRLDPASLADCFVGQPFPAVEEGTRLVARTGPDGEGSAYFEVRPAGNLPALGCSAAQPCSILVYENDGVPFAPDELPTSAVTAELRFAPAPSDCPPVTDFDVRADGEASGAGPFYGWAAELCSGDDPLVLDYTETSSNSGRENFLAGLVDIGVTSLPADETELEEHPDHPAFAYAPVDLTALAVVFNMRDPYTGARIENLTLTPRLLARLVTNSDISAILADAEWRTLNPGVRFPSISVARPLLRAERNADTRLVTSWMVASEGARKFLSGDDEFGMAVNSAYREYTYPRDTFENVAQDPEYVPRTGQRNVALRVFYGVRPNGSAPENTEETGFIGVVDLPTARRFGLPVAKIVNAGGEAVSPTEDAILAGFRAMREVDSGVLAADPEAADPEAYPLVKVDYAMVPTEATAAKARDIAALLRYVAGPGQADLPSGYLPLPEGLRKQTEAVAGSLGKVPETTTTTTTTVPNPRPAAVPVTAPVPTMGYPGGGGSPVASGGPSPVTAGRSNPRPVAETVRIVLADSAAARLLPLLLGVGAAAGVGLVVSFAGPALVRRRRPEIRSVR